MSRVVALFRAVNVAGHRPLQMADVRARLVARGYRDVESYLQSGNVVLDGAAERPGRVEAAIEAVLAEATGAKVVVLVRDAAELSLVARGNPFAARGDPGSVLHATFLKSAPEGGLPEALVAPGDGPDELALGDRVVYLRCPGGYGRTKLHNAFLERRLKVAATTRNWNTVTRLVELAGG